jgi:uncharacterized protein (DUF305 family)
MTRRLPGALVGALVGVGVLVSLPACSSGTSSPDKGGAAVVSTGFNDADVLFAQSMIPHHEQAIEMADLALDPASGASAAVRELAARVKAAQDPENAALRAWLKARGKSETMDMAGHDMAAMDGMLTAAEMKALDDATGPAFDRAFYEQLIRHHEGAVAMAQVVRDEGVDPQIAAIADSVIAGQSAELAEMTKALGR